MPTLLKNLKIDTIGSVDNPANKHARVVLFKRDDSQDFNKAEWTTAYVNALPDSSFAVIEPGGEKDEEGKTKPRSLRHLPYKDRDGKVDLPHLRNALARLPQSNLSPELKEKARKVLDAAAKEAGIGEYKMSKAGRAISTQRLGMLKQMQELLAQLIADGEKYLEEAGINPSTAGVQKGGDDQVLNWEEIKKSLPEEAQKQIGELEKKAAQADELTAKVVDLEKKLAEKDPASKEEEIWKGVNPEIRKRMEELKKEAEEAKALAKKEHEERIKKEYVAKAAAFQGLPVKPEEFGLVLKSLAEKDPENYAKIEATLKAADEAIQKGALFAEVGRGGNYEGDSAIAKLTAKAQEIRKSEPKLTKEQAFVKACEDNPELYKQYRQEEVM